MGYGVIGNTTDFDFVVLGSNPSTPTKLNLLFYMYNWLRVWYNTHLFFKNLDPFGSVAESGLLQQS